MDSILSKEPVQRASKALKDFSQNLNIICLDQTAKTAQDAATALGCGVGAIVKSLLFKASDTFLLCLVSGNKKCSLNKLKKITEIKDISMASPDDVKRITGYTIGGVSPVGHLEKLKIYLDSTLEQFKDIYAAAGHPNCVFKISFIDLHKMTNSEIADITE
jgi:Cys-tRNA(Pro) deacylase